MLAKGQCRCGKVEFKTELPLPLEDYHPRECDCDFCISRGIQYVSDPDGILFLQKQYLNDSLKQGDRLADFIVCSQCDDVIAVVFRDKNQQKAAINATLLNQYKDLGKPLTVSPKLLDSAEKVARWQSLWLELIIV